ncbi:MAG: hypothetical protein K5765_02835, partial [Clostridia bacterium]|nr:hypothetical protein [Clostridia bacterium]
MEYRIKRLVFFAFVILILPILVSCGGTNNSNNRSGSGSGGSGNNEPQTTKQTLTEDMVYIFSNNIDYTGRPINAISYIKLNDEIIDLSEFDITYQNNVEIGRNKASVTVTAKSSNKKLKGSVTKYFSIVNRTDQVISTLEQINQKFDAGYVNVVLESNATLTIQENESLIIFDGCSLEIPQSSMLINYGSIETALEQGSNGGSIENKGTIVNYETGTITINARFFNRGSVYNNGTFLNNGNAGNFASFYTIPGKEVEFTWNNSREGIVRKDASSSNDDFIFCYLDNSTIKHFEKNDAGKFIVPYKEGYYFIVKTSDNGLDSKYYSIDEYDGIGTYEINLDFSTSQMSNAYYGSTKLEYEVIRSEITVSTFEEFKEAVTNDNYSKYTYDGRTNLVISENVVIPANKVFENTSGNNIVVNASITLNNKGIIDNSSANIVINGTLENENQIEAEGLSAQTGSNIVNSGTITLDNSGNQIKGSLSNAVEGTISFSKDTNLYDSQITNLGTIINNGKIHINNKEENNFVNTGSITNNGEMYIYQTIQNIQGNEAIIKKDISTLATLKYDSYDYDGQAHPAEVLIEGESFGWITKQYDRENLINAGSINATITVTNDYTQYYGQATLSYVINKVEKVISSNDSFSTTVSNTNYSSFVLGRNVEINSGTSITINAPLDLAGYALKLRYGTQLIINADVTAPALLEANKTDTFFTNLMLFDNSKLIIDKHTLNNEGNIYLEAGANSKLDIDTVTGNGNIYADGNTVFRVDIDSNENSVFVRTNIDSLTTENLYLAYTEITYNAQIQNPDVYIFDGNNLVSNYGLIKTYPSSVTRGEYEVNIAVENTYFDSLYYGSTKKQYSIVPNSLAINKSNFTQEVFNISMYDRYYLTENIDGVFDITIPSGVVIDLGEYRLTKLNSNYPYSTLTLEDNVEFNVAISTKQEFDVYKYIATKITLSGDISNSLEIDFSDTVDTSNSLILQHVHGYNPYNLTIDLNGYSITGDTKEGLLINNTVSETTKVNGNDFDKVKLSIINSSDNMSNITTANGNTYYSLYVTSIGDKHLSFDINGKVNTLGNNNIKIYGINFGDVSNSKTNNTYFNSNYVDYSQIKQTVFNVATVNGVLVTVKNSKIINTESGWGVQIYGGVSNKTHLFENCVISSYYAAVIAEANREGI